MLVNVSAQEHSGNFSGFPKRLLIDEGNVNEAHIRLNKPFLGGQEDDDCLQHIAFKLYDGEAQLPISDEDLTPKAEKSPWQLSFAISSNPRQQGPLCILFRMFNATGYSGDDNIYFATYLREYTHKSLKRKICEKLAIDFACVTDVLVSYQNGNNVHAE
ncbi:hypothetical protein N7523_002058 [Penicillium sp. IBT 18751x]|nr:hypothetical protein N7523_002058 [Penicillium sp. IBT 18751x]